MNADYREIVRYAAMAPSGHNTQPWKFRIAAGSITLVPDFIRALPVVDPDHRELYISLGCAVENLAIAAGHFGYQAQLTECSREKLVFALSPCSGVEEDVLFRQLEKRQTNRSVYSGKKIPPEVAERLKVVSEEKGVHCYMAENGSSLADLLAAYILKGNEIQMNDPAFKNELISWMRFNARQVKQTSDGLSYRVFGNPPLPGFLARRVVRLFLTPEQQNRTDREKIAFSSHFVVFTADANNFRDWVHAGRVLQRFLLRATASGVACAFMNQPCEVSELATGLQEKLPVCGQYPLLILRIGYADPVPRSSRKSVETRLV